MQILKMLLLTSLCLFTSSVFAQKRSNVNSPITTKPAVVNGISVDAPTGSELLCKGLPLPEGFIVSGEMFSDSCNGAAWIVKRKPSAPLATNGLSNFSSPTLGRVSPGEQNEAIAPGQCDDFQQKIKSTYNFNPAQFNDAQRAATSTKLDSFWNHVRQSSKTLVPCLRKALKEDNSGSFFGIDGSMLLVDIDPSNASKALQVKKFINADLDGVDLEYWVRTMARRGVEGFDVSEAGAKWLSYPNAKYHLTRHGGFQIGSFLGAVFIFGSMEENLATPVLLRIANTTTHPHRDDAIAILSSQATPAAYEAVKAINTAGLSDQARQVIREIIDSPKLLKPRANPKLTREENLRAFQGIVDGDYSAFREMVMKAPDGEVDAVATLRAEDIPLLRRARRASISRCNQHAVSDYASFTSILLALTWKSQ